MHPSCVPPEGLLRTRHESALEPELEGKVISFRATLSSITPKTVHPCCMAPERTFAHVARGCPRRSDLQPELKGKVISCRATLSSITSKTAHPGCMPPRRALAHPAQVCVLEVHQEAVDLQDGPGLQREIGCFRAKSSNITPKSLRPGCMAARCSHDISPACSTRRPEPQMRLRCFNGS